MTAGTNAIIADYLYDPALRQRQKNVGGTKTNYYYAGWQRLADYDGTTNALQQRYVYGSGLDEVLIRVTSGGTKAYFHGNHQGSIVAVTDSSGAVLNRFRYGPYGESSALSGTSHGYTGQRYDSETGLYYYKMRHYSPKLGRFLQSDPIGYGDGLNMYGYAGHNPNQATDTLGLAADGGSAELGQSGQGSSFASLGFGVPNEPYLREFFQFDITNSSRLQGFVRSEFLNGAHGKVIGVLTIPERGYMVIGNKFIANSSLEYVKGTLGDSLRNVNAAYLEIFYRLISLSFEQAQDEHQFERGGFYASGIWHDGVPEGKFSVTMAGIRAYGLPLDALMSHNLPDHTRNPMTSGFDPDSDIKKLGLELGAILWTINPYGTIFRADVRSNSTTFWLRDPSSGVYSKGTSVADVLR